MHLKGTTLRIPNNWHFFEKSYPELGYLLFHLAHLQTPYYKAVRDVLSTNYVCPKRLINDQVDCDNDISD